jgi:polar amino acid transport system substrate-binding protein
MGFNQPLCQPDSSMSRSTIAASMGRWYLRVVAGAVCAGFLVVTFMLGAWAIARIRDQVAKDLQSSLKTVLNTSMDVIRIWAETQCIQLEQIAKNRELIALAGKQAAHFRESGSIDAELLGQTRRFFAENADHLGNMGYFVVSPERINLASMRDDNVGSVNLVQAVEPALLDRAFAGQSVLIPPIPSDVPISNTKMIRGKVHPPTMFVAAPVVDSSGVVLAVLLRRLNPHHHFSRLCAIGRLGQSGETYCFNRDAFLLSESRFREAFIESHFLSLNEQEILSIRLVNPGFDLKTSIRDLSEWDPAGHELTQMALAALEGHEGADMDGYRDYTGAQVVGVWAWMEDLGIGIATEMGFEEAYHSFWLMRQMVWVVLGLLAALVVLVSLLSVRASERRGQTQRQQRLLLESTVLERTFALSESESRFRQMAESIQDVFWLLEARGGGVAYVSPAFERLWGIPMRQIYDNALVWRDQVIAEDLERFDRLRKESMDGTFQAYFRIRRPDGSVRNVFDRYYPVRDEGLVIQRIARISEDCTARRQAELELRKLSRALEQSPVTVVITDQDGTIEYVNSCFSRVTGYEAGEAIGKNPRILKSGRHPVSFYDRMWRCLLLGETWHGEMINRCKDGHEIWEKVAIAGIWDEEGRCTHFVAVKEDITEQKKLELDLIATKEAAEAATKAKSSFLANMSHEIRTPMNAILGMAHLTLKTRLDPVQMRYLQTIQLSGKSLMRIIDDILDFSKIESGKLELERIPFGIEEVFKSLSALMAPRAAEKDLELVFLTDPEVPLQVVGDPLRLTQVLSNLVGNAIKFTEQGEISLRVRLLKRLEGFLELEFVVRDTGIGIEQTQIEKLFQPFTQADTSTTRRFGGTGLGLSICKSIVQQMGGNISAESESGRGSTFRFHARFLEVAEVEASADLSPLHGLKVMVVDDTESVRLSIMRMLESFACRAESAVSGEDALLRLRECPDDDPVRVVLVDWNMPGMDGITTIRSIREEALFQPPARLFLMTAFGKEKLMERAYGAGIDGFLVKPMTASMLHDTIAQVMHGESMVHAIPDPVSPVKSGLPMETHKRKGRLLLVEDHAINQEVACTILRQHGYEVELAGNGQEAVDRVALENFDLVLMDIQMPLMDGYEATRQIRGKLGKTDLPIVAMTANVLAGEREKCSEAGMNAHVGKPIDPVLLLDLLDRFLGGPEVATPVAAESSPEPDLTVIFPVDPVLPSWEGWDWASALARVNGSADRLKRLLFAWTSMQQAEWLQIRDAWKKGDIESVTGVLHRMRGCVLNLGGKVMGEQIGVLESSMRKSPDARNDEGIKVMLDSLQSTCEINSGLLRSESHRLMHSGEGAVAAPVVVAEGVSKVPEVRAFPEGWASKWNQRLDDLERQIADMDPGAHDAAERLQWSLAGHDAVHLAQRMTRHLFEFEFNPAAGCLKELRLWCTKQESA